MKRRDGLSIRSAYRARWSRARPGTSTRALAAIVDNKQERSGDDGDAPLPDSDDPIQPCPVLERRAGISPRQIRLIQHSSFAMRNIIIGTILGIAVAVLAYSLMPEDTASELSQATRLHSGAMSAVEIQRRLDELASALQSYQKSGQDQWNRIQAQQARLHRMQADFDRRLRTVEATDATPPAGAAISVGTEADSDTVVMNIDGEQVEIEEVSEVDLGRWMDECCFSP